MIDAPLIEFRSVTKQFAVGGSLFGKKRYIKAVDNVSFRIGEGETVALVGESGCGKTTLGRLALARLKPTSGLILYKGKDLRYLNKAEYREYRRNAQVIHQDPYDALNPMRTVYQSLSPALLRYRIVRNKEEARKKVSDLLKLVGLIPPEDFMPRYPARLSGGQMQRVAIARAISVRPKFIVADEAVSMLDASLRISVLDILLNLKRRLSMACLFITHDLAIARYFAQDGRMMVMYLGKIVETGSTEEIIREPLHPYTKALISAVPVPDPKIARERRLPHLRSLEIPRLTELPSGCRFHTRCPMAKEICTKYAPELREVKKGHFVACHLY